MILLLGLLSLAAVRPFEVPESPRIARLARDVAGGKGDAADAFWTEVRRKGAPLVETPRDGGDQLLVTFVYEGDSATRRVVLWYGAEISPRLDHNALINLSGTHVWYRTYLVRRDGRFTYKFAVNTELTAPPSDPGETTKLLNALELDPLNPNKFPEAPGLPAWYANSVVELPGAPPQPWVAARNGVARGKLDSTMVKSALLGNERAISVYTPPGYDPAKGPYRLLVVFDRGAYLYIVPTPTILDNLTAAGQVPPHVAVFVSNPNNSRSEELPCNRKFADFLATELLPWVRERYAVSPAPAHITLAGSSFGGLASACSALFHPEAFGNVISQSGSFSWPDSAGGRHARAYHQFAEAPKVPVRFYIEVGLMDRSWVDLPGPTHIEANRRFRDLLRSKGLEVHYTEFNGGHDFVNWRGTLADGLVALQGR